MRNNAHLWLNDFEELVGFVISENGESDLTVFVKRGCEYLYSEMINWVKTNWSNREGVLNTEVHEYHNNYIQVLEEEGFQKKELVAVTRQYVLAEKVMEEV